MAVRINETPKLVFSNSLERTPWGKWDNASVVSGDAVSEMKKLKQQDGKDMILWGSISLAQSFMKAGLVDGLQLFTVPVLLGEGRLFFEGVDEVGLSLRRNEGFGSGVVLGEYGVG